jgi:hypothetical protein
MGQGLSHLASRAGACRPAAHSAAELKRAILTPPREPPPQRRERRANARNLLLCEVAKPLRYEARAVEGVWKRFVQRKDATADLLAQAHTVTME